MLAVFFLLSAFCASAQDRGGLSVFVPSPAGGDEQQRLYFQDNFIMELTGANYAVADSLDSALYVLDLAITDNPDFDPDSPQNMDDNSLFFLTIRLVRSEDRRELVNFDFPFNTTDEMNRWNLYLLYQALANAPTVSPKKVEAPRPDDYSWANKYLYVNLGTGVDTILFARPGAGRISSGAVMPVAWAGIEWHFWNYLSVEADPLKLRMFERGDGTPVFSPSFPLLAKGVFKFSHVMLEVYAGAEYSLNIGGEGPSLSVLGGAQLGFQCGSRAAWTLDAGGSYGALGKAELADGVRYNLLRVTVALGWKTGFIDRK